MSFSFGSSASSNTGFSFGASSSSNSGGFSFGASSSSNSGGGFSFGASSSSSGGGFSFGANSGSSSSGFSFGASSSSSGGGFSFGSSSSSGGSGFSFGANSNSGSGFNFGGNSSSGFNFGNSSSGFNFGGNSSSGFNFGGQNTGVSSTPSALKADTKFSSKIIPETGPTICKKNLKEMELYIRRQTTTKEEVADHLKSYKVDFNVEALGQELSALKSDIKTQISGIQSFQEALRKELKHAEVANRNLLKFNTYGETVYLPSHYHWEKLSEFQAREELMSSQIAEINQYLEKEQHERYPQSLQSILHDQHNALMVITSKVSTLHTMADRLREQYMNIKRLKGENVKDLFKEDEPKKKIYPQVPQAVAQIPQNNQQGMAFGTQNTQQQQGKPSTTSNSSGFNFGNTNNSSSGGFNFGTPASSSSTGFSFSSSSTTKKKSSQKKKKR